MLLNYKAILYCLYFFGMLPFFTHHLAMYANGYLTFDKFSPAVEGNNYLNALGLLIIKILLIVCLLYP